MKAMILGASLAGLGLAHKLLDAGIDVDIYDSRSADDLREGRGQITQLSLPTTRALEHSAWSDLAVHDDEAEPISSIRLQLADPGRAPVTVIGRLPGPGGTGVDPRIKRAYWLEAAGDRGANVRRVTVDCGFLDYFARNGSYEAVVIAAGSGSLITRAFPPDRAGAARITAAGGQMRPRTLAQAYVYGVRRGEADADVVSTPHGEVLVTPVLTEDGMAHCVQLIGSPVGLLDCRMRQRPEYIVWRMLAALEDVAPEIKERLGVDPTTLNTVDLKSVLATEVAPELRDPIYGLDGSTLSDSSTRLRFAQDGFAAGLGETVYTLDPASAQEGAAAPRAAQAMANVLIDCAKQGTAFTTARAREAREAYLASHGVPAAVLASTVAAYWSGDLPDEVAGFFAAAASDPVLGDQWAAAIDDPQLFTALF